MEQRSSLFLIYLWNYAENIYYGKEEKKPIKKEFINDDP